MKQSDLNKLNEYHVVVTLHLYMWREPGEDQPSIKDAREYLYDSMKLEYGELAEEAEIEIRE